MGKKNILKEGKRREPSWDGDAGPSTKKRKTVTGTVDSDLSTDEVQIDMATFINEGLAEKANFISKKNALPFEDIKRWIAGHDDLKMGSFIKFYLYPAFKEALLRIWTEIENVVTDVNRSEKIILVHGVPRIGKTSLAYCISYVLALYAGCEETVCYLQLADSNEIDDDVKSKYVNRFCQGNFVVVDQVNTNDLNLDSILDCATLRFSVGETRVPIVMFTSGHYTPGEEWVENVVSKMICYKVISMQINDAFVSQLRNFYKIENDAVSNADLLEVTTGFARMKKCLSKFTSAIERSSNPLTENLREIVYQRPDQKFIERSSMKHFIWLAWYNIISKELPPFENFTGDYCKMTPQIAEYLGGLLSDHKDKSDKGLNALLNMIDITGQPTYEVDGYFEFSYDSYVYQFMHRKPLYDILKRAREIHLETSLADRHGILTAVFALLTDENDSNNELIRGGLFENIIKTVCEKHSQGMAIYRGEINFHRVKCTEYVSDHAILCDLPLKTPECMSGNMSFWCVLNVPGRVAFKGYDFAYMETKPGKHTPVVEKLQLLQVSINPFAKSAKQHNIMVIVLRDIRKALVKKGLVKKEDIENVVIPYFVHANEHNDCIQIASGTDNETMVDVIGFPKTFFGEKPPGSVNEPK